MKVSLGVPFRSSNPSRISAHDKAWNFRLNLYPWHRAAIFAGDPEGSFNRAAVRNEIADRFSDADVLVICDSDSLPEAMPLWQAIEAAKIDGKVHFPFDIVRVLDPEDHEAYTYGPSAGGCYVLRPDVWRRLGGMDERLGSWGTDDRSFLVAIDTFIGRPVHHSGALTCFWHERDEETVSDPSALKILTEEYLPLYGKPQELSAYIQGRS